MSTTQHDPFADLLGAAYANPAMQFFRHVQTVNDTIANPRTVVAVSKQIGASRRFEGGMIKVVVSGGQRHERYLSNDTTRYENPSSVTIYLKDSKPITFKGLDALEVIAGNANFDGISGDFDVLGELQWQADITPKFDLNTVTKQMNAIKPVTAGIARIILNGAQVAINAAKDLSKETLTTPALPNQAKLDEVVGKLDWHARDNGGGLNKATDAMAIYGPSDDLKKWALQAYIEYNAAEVGRAHSEQLAAQRWNEMMFAVSEALANLPANLAKAGAAAVKAIVEIPKKMVEEATGIPVWAWALGGLAMFGLVGFAAYKVLLVAAPVVGTVAAKRYLP